VVGRRIAVGPTLDAKSLQKNAVFNKIEEQLISGASCVLATRQGLWKSPHVTNEVPGLEWRRLPRRRLKMAGLEF
jgi:hypothetical protein